MAKRAASQEDSTTANEGAEGESLPATKKARKTTQKKSKITETKLPGSKLSASDVSLPSASRGKEGSSGPKQKVQINAEGEKFVDLGKKRRATVRSFKSQLMVDIREFYGSEDDLKPGKKGISLSIEQWEELKTNIATIDGFIKEL
ncbi:hypothetical protein EW145_g3975 [Phellinidium pouzarii]|uniref:Transcriptional coactivator p15 (PC4) C-terminal domain-containing protein n=1 Tax=Phellinidium pouzarii TaxID=167371 RepID=A0A4S4LAC8_9AGAM|nr:hypothetical protein EW145_g3975 [Phellinidium pouzarii]